MTDGPMTPTDHDRAIRAEELAAGPESAVAGVRYLLDRRRELGRGAVMLYVGNRALTAHQLDHQLDRLIIAATTPDPAPTQAAPEIPTVLADRAALAALAALAARIEQALWGAEVVNENDDMWRARGEFGYRPVSEVAAEIATALADRPSAAPTIAVGQTIETADLLDALPVGTVVRTRVDMIAERVNRAWWFAGWVGEYATPSLSLPARVLDLPGAATATGGEA